MYLKILSYPSLKGERGNKFRKKWKTRKRSLSGALDLLSSRLSFWPRRDV